MMRQKTTMLLVMMLGVFGAYTTSAENTPTEPTELLIKFLATGEFSGFDPSTGETSYIISADGIAPEVADNGVIKPPETPFDKERRVTLNNAEITFGPFDPSSPPPIVGFNCQGCTVTFPDGSVLTADTANVPLDGRALFVYGPVAPDPSQAIATIRMMGCAGLRETAIQGRYAGMVGSICFNGVFNFDVSDPTVIPNTLTGSSSCTIVLHTPVSPLPPS